jgi:hypothetical protein
MTIGMLLRVPGFLRSRPHPQVIVILPVLVFLNVYGAPESIPRNEFRQPM